MSSRYCDNIADCFQSCSLHMHNIIVFMALNLRNTDVGMFHFKHGGVSSMPKNTWDVVEGFMNFLQEGACFLLLLEEGHWRNYLRVSHQNFSWDKFSCNSLILRHGLYIGLKSSWFASLTSVKYFSISFLNMDTNKRFSYVGVVHCSLWRSYHSLPCFSV